MRQLSSRTSLRTKLIVALVGLVILALGTLGMIGISILRGYLLGPVDGQLEAVGGSQQITSCVQAYLGGAGVCRVSNYDIYWLTSSGKLEPVWTPQPYTYFSFSRPRARHCFPTSRACQELARGQPAAGDDRTGAGRRQQWRAMGFDVPVTNVQTGAQSAGTIIVATDVTTVYQTLQKLIWVDTIVSAAIVCVLAGVGYAVVRSNLRPLVEIEETAEEIAAAGT